MAQYVVEILCEHVETRIVEATSPANARKKAEDNEWDYVLDWHTDGDISVQSVAKLTEKEFKELTAFSRK